MSDSENFDPRACGAKGRNGPRWLRRLIRKDPFDRGNEDEVDDLNSE